FSWETTPMPLIPTPISQTNATDQYKYVASKMAIVHDCIIRALNSIYLQAPHIPASEYPNFIAYSLAAYRGLCAHHAGEEEMFSPELERLTGEQGLMDENVDGHRRFHNALGEWDAWLEAYQKNEQRFDAERCIRMMDSFMPARFPDLDLRKMMKEEGEKVLGSMSKTDLLPVFLLNHDVGFEDGRHNFPPVPPPVRWVLREVCGRWRSEWWKFATCGYDGRVREVRY
ncbi:hypothetical protein EK21DRAFT_43314, partial [Setomelanomma holmii]